MLLPLSALVVLIALVLATQSRSVTGTASDIGAMVNGDSITLGELQRVRTDLLELSRRQAEQGAEPPDTTQLDQLAIRQLIQRRLMLQEAARRNLTVGEVEIDNALSELRGRFPDLERFGMWMQARGLDDTSLVETIHDDLLVRRLTMTLVNRAEVTPEQVEAYFEEHRDDLTIGEEVRLSIIVVASDEAGQAVLTALSDGANFRRLARKVSLGQRAADGGDTGWVDPSVLPPPLRRAVARMKEGEAYGPLRRDIGEFLIVALAGRRPVRARSLEEARRQIERDLLLAARRQAVEEWLAEQELTSRIEVLLPPR